MTMELDTSVPGLRRTPHVDDGASVSLSVRSGAPARRGRSAARGGGRRALLPATAGLTPAERAARGKAARVLAPLDAHAVLDLPDTRPDPIRTLIDQGTTRVDSLLSLRYARMLVSPFSFLRGSAALMAGDLQHSASTDLLVQACGDAHAANFGVFRTPQRTLTFDVNDFDETLPAPFEWDVKRLAASLSVVGRERGFSAKERRQVVTASVAEYRESVRRFAEQDTLSVWHAHVDVERAMAEYGAEVDRRVRRATEGVVAKAVQKDSLRALAKLTTLADGQRRFLSDPPILVPLEDLFGDVETLRRYEGLRALLRGYRRSVGHDRRHLLEQYRVVQAARKVVGVGSVGTRCWIVLLLGRDDADPLFLQVKEAGASVLESVGGRSEFGNAGQRVVAGQRMMQAHTDDFLGWTRLDDTDGVPRDYYVRQLWDGKGSFDLAGVRPAGLEVYGRICGWTLARAHARSGDRVALAAYLGGSTRFERAVTMFAEAYADQTDADWRALGAARDAGLVEVAATVNG